MIRPTIRAHRMRSRSLAVVTKIVVAVTFTALLLALLNYSSPAAVISQADVNTGSTAFVAQETSQTLSEYISPDNTDYPVDVIPLDETTVLITVRGVELPTTTLFANVSIGPGHVKHSYAMTKSVAILNSVLEVGQYQDTTAYAIATGFSPYENITASLTITTEGAQLAELDFDRAYVPLIEEGEPPDEAQDRFQRFGLYIDGGTFPDDNYMAFIPDPTAMPPMPDGYTLLGDIFDINSLGDMPNADKLMELRFYPDAVWLDGHAVQTLAILILDPVADEWVELPSGRRTENGEQRVAFTAKFTAYALAASRTWIDPFAYMDGLDNPQNVRLLWSAGSFTLVLDEESTHAVATSVPINLPFDGLRWASVEFTGTENPPETSFQIDLLGSEGAVILEDVDPMTDLSAIDPVLHPTLRLRATLQSQTLGESPTLNMWRISWEQRHVEEVDNIYLPVVIR